LDVDDPPELMPPPPTALRETSDPKSDGRVKEPLVAVSEAKKMVF
jgi:hypothetical protein